MYGKTLLFLLGFLLVASQVNAGANINAKLEGKVDVTAALTDIFTQLDGLLSASVGNGVELSVLGNDISIDFDNSAEEPGTVAFDVSELTEDGHFAASFALNDLVVALTATVNGEGASGSLSFSLEATVNLEGTVGDEGLSLALASGSAVVSNTDVELDGVSAAITLALETALQAQVNAALTAATDALVSFGNAFVVVVEAPVRDTFEEIPRVTVTLEVTLDEFEENRQEIVANIVTALAELEIGDFAAGIFFGDVKAGASGEVVFDMWILDNEDGKSGKEASEEMEAAFESGANAELFEGVKSFKVNSTSGSSDDGDGDSESAATRFSSILF